MFAFVCSMIIILNYTFYHALNRYVYQCDNPCVTNGNQKEKVITYCAVINANFVVCVFFMIDFDCFLASINLAYSMSKKHK